MMLVCTSAGGLWLHNEKSWTGTLRHIRRRQSEERFGKDARQTDRGRGGRQQRRFVHRGSSHLVLKTQIIPDMNNKIRRTAKLVAENKFYLLLLGEDSQAEVDGLLVVVHLIVFLIHPLIKGIGV